MGHPITTTGSVYGSPSGDRHSSVVGSPVGKGAHQSQQLQPQPSTSSGGMGGLQTSSSGMPTAADFSLMLSLGLGLNPADPNQLANIDLQKLAMYLVSIMRFSFRLILSHFKLCYAFLFGGKVNG